MIDENLNLHWTIFADNVVSLVGDKTVEKKNKVQIAYSQIFLRLLHLLSRYISPYILIRLILKLIKKLKGL